ncbi:MAG: hypothetical protein U1F15_10610 [Burkholderiales bacterium]
MNKTLSALLLSMCVAVIQPALGAETGKPDATIEVAGSSVGVGVGFTEAKGTLTYQGKRYPVTLQGVSLAQVGASSITAAGEVYHLARLQDVTGSYAAASAGAALSDGRTETTMKNQNGVVMKLHTTSKGVDLRLSVDGVSVKLAD